VVRGAIVVCCELALGCAPGTETPDGSDGGSVDRSDAGNAGGVDAGNEPQPLERRSFDSSGSATATTSLGEVIPTSSGNCVVLTRAAAKRPMTAPTPMNNNINRTDDSLTDVRAAMTAIAIPAIP
jgi:hypothetical protein